MVKSRSKNEEKRKQILNAATQLFVEHGYIATSMMQIATQADVSKQTVYSHFGSKEDLFAEAIKQKCDSAIDIDFDTLDFTDVRATLLMVAKQFFTMITSKEALAVHKICAFESRTYPQLSELFYQAGPERITEEIAKLMSEFDKLGMLEIKEPRFAAIQFLHMVKGEAWMRVEFNTQKQLSVDEVQQYIECSVDFFLRGYA